MSFSRFSINHDRSSRAHLTPRPRSTRTISSETSQPCGFYLCSVSLDDGEVEWGSKGLSSLFARKRNAVSLGFYAMLREMGRFNREAPRLLELDDEDPRKVRREARRVLRLYMQLSRLLTFGVFVMVMTYQ